MSAPPDEQLRRLGASLREIDRSLLDADPAEGPVRWFLGDGGTELTAWLDDAGAPRHIQLVFARVSVEWSARGLVTGAFEARSSTAGGRYDPYLLQVGAGIDPEVCRAGLTLLDAASAAAELARPLWEALTAALGGEDGGQADEAP